MHLKEIILMTSSDELTHLGGSRCGVLKLFRWRSGVFGAENLRCDSRGLDLSLPCNICVCSCNCKEKRKKGGKIVF